MSIYIARAEEVIWRRIGEEVVVIKDDGLSTHVLNKTAGFIWELADGKLSIDEIVARLCERFEVSSEEARIDVEQLIAKLAAIKLLNRTGELIES
jgi:hypothetical protein